MVQKGGGRANAADGTLPLPGVSGGARESGDGPTKIRIASDVSGTVVAWEKGGGRWQVFFSCLDVCTVLLKTCATPLFSS